MLVWLEAKFSTVMELSLRNETSVVAKLDIVLPVCTSWLAVNYFSITTPDEDDMVSSIAPFLRTRS